MALQPCQQIALDSPSEHGFLAFLRSLPEKLDTTFRVFDRSEYFTVHGSDALFAAKEVFKTNSVIKYLGGDKKVPSVALSKMNFESMLRDLLLVRQYRVELYRNKGGKTNNSWEIVAKASPGNLYQFDEILFGNNEMSASAVVIAIKLATENGQRIVGAAYADNSSRKFGLSQFVDDDQFSNLEALLVQLGPKECLLAQNDSTTDSSKMQEIIRRSNILVTERKKAEFSNKDIVQDLNRLLKLAESANSRSLPEMDMTCATMSLAALIKYLELLSDETNFGQFLLESFDLKQFMKLDAAAVRALNLFPSQQDGGNRSMCLLGLLNKCKTAQGQRLLAQWIKQPLMDKNKIGIDELKKFPDFSRLSKKFQRKKATLQDCVKVYQTINRLSSLVESLERCQGPHVKLIDEWFKTPIQNLMEDFDKFSELIETTIDLEQVENHEYLIKASFDEGLQECKEQMDDLLEKIPAELNKVMAFLQNVQQPTMSNNTVQTPGPLSTTAARDLGLDPSKTLKLESNNQLGYFFRVTRKEEKALRNNKKYITIDTRKDGIRFTNSSLKQLNEEYQGYRTMYNDVQSKLADEVLRVAGGYSEPMQSLSDIVAQLDVLVSFAHVSSNAAIPFVRPTLSPQGQGDINLQSSRHPCLEMQDGCSFIANDAELTRDQKTFLIITGPNMGGKSTYIRQIGVIVLMAQIGCFVPCDSARISLVDCILARVGSGDSQQKGVSTFMSEMLETASILKSATKDSLIIIDELGRGTSTYDGFGLAWAISEYIATKIKCFCLFATHFHELTALADIVPIVTNLHVTAMVTGEVLTLLYKVMSDESGFSPSKRRRMVKQDGEKIIQDFLGQVKNLASGSLTDEEIMSEIERLKQDVKAQDNMYIRQLCDGTKV